jgi:hypothetical protein
MRTSFAVHLKPGQVKPAADVKCVNTHRTSLYDPIAAQIRALKPGEALILPMPPGSVRRECMNRMNAGLSRYKFKFPGGFRIIRRWTDKGEIAIMLRRAR